MHPPEGPYLIFDPAGLHCLVSVDLVPQHLHKQRECSADANINTYLCLVLIHVAFRHVCGSQHNWMIQRFGADQNILSVIGWIFCCCCCFLLGFFVCFLTDIHGPKKLNSNNFNWEMLLACGWMDILRAKLGEEGVLMCPSSYYPSWCISTLLVKGQIQVLGHPSFLYILEGK